MQVLIHDMKAEADGTLHSLELGDAASFDVLIQVLEGADAIDGFLARVGAQSAAHEVSCPYRTAPVAGFAVAPAATRTAASTANRRGGG